MEFWGRQYREMFLFSVTVNLNTNLQQRAEPSVASRGRRGDISAGSAGETWVDKANSSSIQYTNSLFPGLWSRVEGLVPCSEAAASCQFVRQLVFDLRDPVETHQPPSLVSSLEVKCVSAQTGELWTHNISTSGSNTYICSNKSTENV